MAWLGDSFVNLLSSLGVIGRDKGAVSTAYQLTELNEDQINMAYRSDWIVGKAVDIPADDSTREWRSWQADNADITLIEELEKKFGIQGKMLQAIKYGRLYGGGALIMGVDDSEDMMEPLDLKRVGRDSLKFVHAVPKRYLNCGQLLLDVGSEWFGRPEWYESTTSVNALPGGVPANALMTTGVRFHPSRVIPFFGSERLDTLDKNEPWSDSILQKIDDAVKGAGLTVMSLAHLIQELKIDVIKIEDLTEQLGTEESTAALTKRFTYANTQKSIINALILDKNDEWQRLQMNLTGVPDVILVYMMIASAAVDIPATRFLSQSPKGLNATGESDIRNHYDRVRSEQNNKIKPKITPLDEVLIRSSLGSRPDGIFYEWNPLWQLSDKESAEVNYTNAQAFKIDVDSGVINEDALRRGRVNQLVEQGTYPGLEDAIEEFGEEPEEPAINPLALAVNRAGLPLNASAPGLPGGRSPGLRALPAPGPRLPGDSLRVGDATPRSLEVYRQLLPDSARELRTWAQAQGIPDILPADELCVEIFCTPQAVDWMKAGADDYWNGEGDFVIPAGGPRVVEKDECGLCLCFASNRITYRHQALLGMTVRTYGIEESYPDDQFSPCIIISNNRGDNLDLSKIEPFRGALRFGPEIFENYEEEPA